MITHRTYRTLNSQHTYRGMFLGSSIMLLCISKAKLFSILGTCVEGSTDSGGRYSDNCAKKSAVLQI